MSEFLDFFVTQKSEIAKLTWEHFYLVGVSVSLACAFGIPLGVGLTRCPKAGKVVLSATGIIQTVPSLALIGLIMILPLVGGIGAKPAISALFLYSLLAIVRNSYVGVKEINPVLMDVGEALGMTPWQMIKIVALPQALPYIMAGIRISTVIAIGTAPLGAAIGAGGLGEFIFRGIYRNNTVMILWGAIPAALFALIADAFLGQIERRLKR